MNNDLGKKAVSGMLFKLLERASVQVVALVVSVLLARLLDPAEYGIIAMANVVIEILNVFVNYGLGTAIIHNKDAAKEEISTCFWASMVLGVVMYWIVFALAEPIAAYFQNSLLVPVIRILGIQLIFAVINSVQTALIAKHFMFRQYFVVTLVASALSGIAGVSMAYCGLGIWSLVAQTLLSISLITTGTMLVLKWRPAPVFSIQALKNQVSYAWKLLVVGFVDCIYAEIRNVIIAKKYSFEDLAYYNKGAQFPKLISNTVNQSVISVLFPVFSMVQDDENDMRQFIKQSLSTLTFCLFPVMVGLMTISEDLVRVLLTDKWVDCVPYMQILCMAYMITPIQSVYKQSLKAVGKTRLLMTANFAEKLIGILLLILAISKGLDAICWSFVLYHITGFVIYMSCGHKVFQYKILRQILDLIPNAFAAFAMAICMNLIALLPLGLYVRCVLQIVIGIITYFLLAVITGNRNIKLIKNKLFPPNNEI